MASGVISTPRRRASIRSSSRPTRTSPLKEDDAYPAQPQDAYGWEKLITERLCMHYREDYGIETRIVRFHNIFGPLGTWEGGREKAPAAMCRKVAVAKLTGNPVVEIWGDGEQTRSFCYIDDCVEGFDRLMRSDFHEPLNLGQDRMVTINQLADMVAEIAGMRIVKKHIDGPMGVRGRNSDNTLLRRYPRLGAADFARRGVSEDVPLDRRAGAGADAGLGQDRGCGRESLGRTPRHFQAEIRLIASFTNHPRHGPYRPHRPHTIGLLRFKSFGSFWGRLPDGPEIRRQNRCCHNQFRLKLVLRQDIFRRASFFPRVSFDPRPRPWPLGLAGTGRPDARQRSAQAGCGVRAPSLVEQPLDGAFHRALGSLNSRRVLLLDCPSKIPRSTRLLQGG